MRFIALIFAMLFSCSAFAQIPMTGAGKGSPSGGGGNDAATTAWVNQVIARSGTVSGTQITNVNNLIVCLKTGSATNFFNISDRLMLMASENITQAETDIINPSATQGTNTATFTANKGVAGNGSTTFFDTKWVPASGTNCVLNSCSLMLYDGSTNFGGAGPGRLGIIDGSNNGIGLRFLSTTSIDFYLNASGGTGQTVSNVKSIFIGTRTAAGATQTFQNGSSVGTGTDASTAVPVTFSFYAAGGWNELGSLNFSTGMTDTMGAFGILSGLNATQAGQYNTCIQNYLTAVGA
jgi:hypothetical protein